MNVSFTEESWADYLYWQSTDKRVLHKINELIKVIQRTPFEGIGKPEPLRHQLKGFWSRRIDLAHRLVYEVRKSEIVVISCRYHYE
jgi:toxin YoeB